MISSFENQDQVLSTAFSILHAAIAQRVFPGASVAVLHSGNLVALKAFGKFVYDEDLEDVPLLPDAGKNGCFEVSSGTLFDLASLTKAVATTTVAAMLYERGLLELDAPVVGTVPEFLHDRSGDPDPRRGEVTFRMLLAHSSGLPAYEKLFLRTRTREELLQAAFTTPLSADPTTHAEYSDIGFITLGIALERIAGESFDAFCQREIFGPLAMMHTTFNPPAIARHQIPPTADERETPERRKDCAEQSATSSQPIESQKPRSTFRRRIIQGEVQDENAFILGGVAGHAGLFSTVEDLARFAHAMIQGGRPILRPETVALFTRRESAPAGTSRALGWDTPAAPSQSGKYFGPKSFGHLGYTGTSLWIDHDRQFAIVLLTNRTWPNCTNQFIKTIRPRFHDAVVEALQKT